MLVVFAPHHDTLLHVLSRKLQTSVHHDPLLHVLLVTALGCSGLTSGATSGCFTTDGPRQRTAILPPDDSCWLPYPLGRQQGRQWRMR